MWIFYKLVSILMVSTLLGFETIGGCVKVTGPAWKRQQLLSTIADIYNPFWRDHPNMAEYYYSEIHNTIKNDCFYWDITISESKEVLAFAKKRLYYR